MADNNQILTTLIVNEFDKEWADLILEAKQIGLTIDDVKMYFKEENSEGTE